MPVSGIVLTLSPNAARRRAALDALDADPRLTVGEPTGPRLPVVTDTDTMDAHGALWDELEALDGVVMVELAFHDFSDVGDFHAFPRRRLRPRKGD